jgi:hypothetical protein
MKIKPADSWFSKCVRLSANYTCQKCGKVYSQDEARGLDCSHIFGRRHRSVRWAKENAIALCVGCHRWWHENPTESGLWLRSVIGEGAYSLLVEKKNQCAKVTKKEEKEIAAHYKKEHALMVLNSLRDFESWQ